MASREHQRNVNAISVHFVKQELDSNGHCPRHGPKLCSTWQPPGDPTGGHSATVCGCPLGPCTQTRGAGPRALRRFVSCCFARWRSADQEATAPDAAQRLLWPTLPGRAHPRRATGKRLRQPRLPAPALVQHLVGGGLGAALALPSPLVSGRPRVRSHPWQQRLCPLPGGPGQHGPDAPPPRPRLPSPRENGLWTEGDKLDFMTVTGVAARAWGLRDHTTHFSRETGGRGQGAGQASVFFLFSLF